MENTASAPRAANGPSSSNESTLSTPSGSPQAANAQQQPKKAMPALPPRAVAARQPKQHSNAVANGPSESNTSQQQSQQPQSAASSSRGPSLRRPGGNTSPATAAASSSSSNGRAMPSLPARVAGSGTNVITGVIDPEESEATQKLRANVHDIRVRLIRAARRLGYEHDNGLVKQVLYRLYLAEKLKEPFRKNARRPDAAALAARDATKLETEEGPNSPLNLNIKILVIGLRGTGKTQLIRSILSMDPSSSSSSTEDPSSSSSSIPVDPFQGGTWKVEVKTGTVLGITLTMIDTPGLTASAAGTAANAGVLKGIKKAFKQHQPDLVLYVDRFDQPSRAGGELSVLQALTTTCGSHIWLNTIVALTHAGTLPPSTGQGAMSWDAYSQQRSQLLQLIIRSASGDARLMNPISFAESHPGCRRNGQGQAVIPSGLAWQQHMLVLIVSAKLLADAEAALQMTPEAAAAGGKKSGGGAGALDAASIRQMMGRPEGPPVRYLMTQLTGFNQPLTYPDHGSIMELRNAKKQLRKVKGWRDRKELSRQIRFRMLQMQQMQRRQQRTNDLWLKATRAGGKLQLEQPRTANKVRPSVQPPTSHRYRALEPSSGWIVRPQIEPHGMDNSDNVEGFLAEKSGVWRPATCSSGGCSSSGDSMLHGAPYRMSGSINAGKEQMLMQARGDMSLYHDLAGLATTALSADVQTSGAAGTPDLLMVLRMDAQRRGFPLAQNNPTVGLMLSRLAQECRPLHGPLATGVRIQDCVRMMGPGGAQMELDMALGKMFCRPGVDSDDAWGANTEFRTDARRLINSKYSTPLSISGSLMNHRDETMAAISAAVQVQQGRRSGIGGKLQLNSRGVATLGVQVRSDGSQWGALVGIVPLFNLGLGMLMDAFAERRGKGTGGEQEEQQQMGQHLPQVEHQAGVQ